MAWPSTSVPSPLPRENGATYRFPDAPPGPSVEFGRFTGDFADGLIAYDGAWLGGETFVSFDKKAVSLLAKQGLHAEALV